MKIIRVIFKILALPMAVACSPVNRQRKKAPVVEKLRITWLCSEFQTE